ncbi:unannotated protein [freshwater metagenome]|uniref:Unannotated protein n=1 Tax=freshwater metagenome TaxID=449393 RepID=A0A6J7I1A4_9ZZZZ|nr:hypothetical protein [Actinomycetota bacterium]
MTRTIVLVPLLTLALTWGTAAQAGASGTSDVGSRARAFVAMTHERFMAQAASVSAPFDWATDGCTATPASWAATFRPACVQHDFGYRNLGYGLRLSRLEATRRWIDERFLDEMRRICDAGRRGLRRVACRTRATLMWAAVRVANRPWT